MAGYLPFLGGWGDMDISPFSGGWGDMDLLNNSFEVSLSPPDEGIIAKRSSAISALAYIFCNL